MRIEDFLKSAADSAGRDAAIVVAGRTHSYGQLGRAAAQVATALVEGGVKRGDRVATVMDNSFAAVVATFAILMAGGVVCVIGRPSDADELAAAIVRHRAIGLVTEARFASVVATALARSAHMRVVILSGGGCEARAGANAGCLSLEHLMTRIAPVRALLPAGAADDPAMIFDSPGAVEGVTLPFALSHADLIDAADSAQPGEGVIVRSIFSLVGFCHLLKAMREGVTVALQAPFEPGHRLSFSAARRPGAWLPFLEVG